MATVKFQVTAKQVWVVFFAVFVLTILLRGVIIRAFDQYAPPVDCVDTGPLSAEYEGAVEGNCVSVFGQFIYNRLIVAEIATIAIVSGRVLWVKLRRS